MRRIKVDCRNIAAPAAFQIYLQYLMSYPGWYGRNLDAMYDMLTEETEPLHMVFLTGEKMAPEMKNYLTRVKQVLEDVRKESRQFTYEFITE